MYFVEFEGKAERIDDSVALDRPQRPGEAISLADIDRLFS